MNLKALITALVIVGSSSVAMARPATTTSASANAQISVAGSWSFGFGGSSTVQARTQIRDHRTPVRTPARTPVRPVRFDDYDRYGSFGNEPVRQYNARDWMALGVREAGTTTYFTMPTNDPIYSLHLEAVSGRPAITSIFVRYHDGSQQEIPVNTNLYRGGITVPLLVKNSAVHQIIFWSPESASGSFSASIGL